jgi:hypothetical protein
MDEKLQELRQHLDQRTTEIEALVAQEEGMGSIEKMDPPEYERLQERVEELLEQWEEKSEGGASSENDTPLSKLIAERFDVERQILAIREQSADEGEVDEDELENTES